MHFCCPGVLAVAALSFAAITAIAQQPQPASQPPANQQPSRPLDVPQQTKTYTLHTTTSLVILDVVVTDRKGNVIRNLKREDFHVTEAGVPQTVTSFEETGANLLAPTGNINSTADLDRVAPDTPVNIILLDEFNTRFEDMAFARYSLKKFLDAQPAKLISPTELIAVSLDRFTVLHDYTEDKHALLDALDHHFVAYPWQVHSGAWVAERYARAFETLRSVALATEGHPGHKNMIWIGRGFPSIDPTTIDPASQDALEETVENTVNTLRDARVTLYTIDPAGLMSDPGKYGGGALLGDSDTGFISIDSDPFGGNFEFGRLAIATGGRNLYGRNDVDAQIGTAVRDGSSFYTITYRPTGSSTESAKFRAIEITIDRPGLVATTRKGYYPDDKPLQPLSASEQKNSDARTVGDLIAATQTSMVYDGVKMTVTPSAQPGFYRIRISPQSIHWLSGDKYTYTDVMLIVSTFDRKGKELERKVRNLRVSFDTQASAASRGIDLTFPFTPNPIATRVHFVVRISDTGRIGSQDLPLAPASGSTPRK